MLLNNNVINKPELLSLFSAKVSYSLARIASKFRFEVTNWGAGYTDGNTIALSRELFEEKNQHQLLTVLFHELAHIQLYHFDIKPEIENKYDHMTINIAQDYEVSNFYPPYMVKATKELNGLLVSDELRGKPYEEILSIMGEEHSQLIAMHEKAQEDLEAAREEKERTKNKRNNNPEKIKAQEDYWNCVNKEIVIRQKIEELFDPNIRTLPPRCRKPIDSETLEEIKEILSEISAQADEKGLSIEDFIASEISNNEKSIEAEEKYNAAIANKKNLNIFINVFTDSVKKECARQRISTYRKPSRRTDLFGIKGKARTEAPQKTVAVYVDLSGSFTVEKTSKALSALDKIKKIENVNFVVKYFANQVGLTPYDVGNAGTNYSNVIKDVSKNNYDTAILLTDSDLNGMRTMHFIGEEYKNNCKWSLIYFKDYSSDRIYSNVKNDFILTTTIEAE